MPPKGGKRRSNSVEDVVADAWEWKKVCIDIDPNALIGQKVKVWWDGNQAMYEGMVLSFDENNWTHRVHYNDGEQSDELLVMERVMVHRAPWPRPSSQQLVALGAFLTCKADEAEQLKPGRSGRSRNVEGAQKSKQLLQCAQLVMQKADLYEEEERHRQQHTEHPQQQLQQHSEQQQQQQAEQQAAAEAQLEAVVQGAVADNQAMITAPALDLGESPAADMHEVTQACSPKQGTEDEMRFEAAPSLAEAGEAPGAADAQGQKRARDQHNMESLMADNEAAGCSQQGQAKRARVMEEDAYPQHGHQQPHQEGSPRQLQLQLDHPDQVGQQLDEDSSHGAGAPSGSTDPVRADAPGQSGAEAPLHCPQPPLMGHAAPPYEPPEPWVVEPPPLWPDPAPVADPPAWQADPAPGHIAAFEQAFPMPPSVPDLQLVGNPGFDAAAAPSSGGGVGSFLSLLSDDGPPPPHVQPAAPSAWPTPSHTFGVGHEPAFQPPTVAGMTPAAGLPTPSLAPTPAPAPSGAGAAPAMVLSSSRLMEILRRCTQPGGVSGGSGASGQAPAPPASANQTPQQASGGAASPQPAAAPTAQAGAAQQQAPRQQQQQQQAPAAGSQQIVTDTYQDSPELLEWVTGTPDPAAVTKFTSWGQRLSGVISDVPLPNMPPGTAIIPVKEALEIMKALEQHPVTMNLLETTQICKAVAMLRSHRNLHIAQHALQLASAWRSTCMSVLQRANTALASAPKARGFKRVQREAQAAI